jgi:hypothetical protein
MAKNPFLSSLSESDDTTDSTSSSASNPFLESAKEQQKRREKEQEAKFNADALKKEQDQKQAADDKKKADDNKSLLDRAGDVVKGAGEFVGNAAKDVADSAVGAVTGVKDVIEGQQKAQDISQNSDAVEQRNREWSQKFGQADESKWKDPEFVKQAQAFSAETSKLANKGHDISQSKDFKESQAVDTKKTAFQAAETFLNVSTLGVGAGAKALAEQGVKQVVKRALLQEAVRAGGVDVIDQVIKQGGKQALKDAAQEALEQGTKSTVSKLAGNVAKDATIGSAYGVTQTGKNDDNAKLDDYLLNVVYGAGIGGAIPIAGAVLKKTGQKVIGALKGEPSVKVKPQVDPNDVNAVLNQAIDEQSDKYGQSTFARVRNWVGDQVDPLRVFAKIDDKYARDNAIPRSKLNSEDSLEDLARRSAASEREAAGLFEQKAKITDPTTGQERDISASDLVKKYKGDSPEGQEFNNYTNLKFLKEIREKKPNYQLPSGLTDDNIDSFIKSYEARNPDALGDLAAKKAVNDMAVDYMAKSGAIGKDEAETIKNSYKNAVPLEKVFPDDLERPQITGKNVGSIAKQTVIQKLETGSDLPISNSFDSMLNRVYKAVSQGNRAKLAQKLLQRSQEGLIDESNIVVGAGNKEARRAAGEQVKDINKGVRYLQRKVVVSNRQMRRISSELSKLNKEGLDISLKDGGQPSMPGFNINSLPKLHEQKGKTVSSRAFFKSLIQADPKGLQTIRDKIANREPKLAAKIDEVLNYQSKIDANKAAKTELKDITAEFTDDPVTGKQIISGIIDGQGYKMEVPPEVAKAVLGLDQQKLPSVLKALAIAKKPFEVAWTGVINPVFSAMSFAFYDTPMSVINSAQGFKTLAPRAIKESIKSIRSSSEFQQKLAAEGARPYGGSGSSSFVRPTAKSIAAQRNILSNIKYTTTHPEVALAKLDIWGGKLANMTRTRVARAAYDDALRIAKKNGENIKDIAIQKRAMENAALAYRTIMPDFDTMSNLTRQINSVVPFYAASVAGTRSLGKALKRDPIGTSAKALALGIAPTIGVTAFSLMQPAGQAFYKDMEASGQTQLLDNNMVVVLPGAFKDDKTGEWKGIIKVPLAPEFRAMNQTTWRSVRGAMGGEGPDASHIALSLFDTVTGGVRTSENPLISTQRILSGEDPRTGERIIKGDMANLPKEEQVYDTTSEAGKFVGGVLGTSPIQGDKLLGQFGLAGQTIKNGGKPVQAVKENVANRFEGAFGEKASNAFFGTYSPIKARRDEVSKEVTSLVKAGRIQEAKRKAGEFNDTLPGKFSKFNQEFGKSDAYDKGWNDLLDGLAIKTSEKSLATRKKQ